ncbi:MAG: hypothetical protein GY711_10480 [bacterium]|nr:hypothetical protein [bacterium]
MRAELATRTVGDRLCATFECSGEEVEVCMDRNPGESDKDFVDRFLKELDAAINECDSVGGD